MTLASLVVFFLHFSSSFASSDVPIDSFDLKFNQESKLHNGLSESNQGSRNTVLLMGPWGSGAPTNGQFQDQNGNPAWNGWTTNDLTASQLNHWHVSDYEASNLNSTPNNMALYCGDEDIPLCDSNDVIGGYGNNWEDSVSFQYIVSDASAPCQVTVSGIFNHNSEPGYDYTTFQFQTADGPVDLDSFDGIGSAVEFSYSMTYEPQDYAGENFDAIIFTILFTSDGGWSDEDCSYFGNGACQIDDIRVQCSNGNFDQTSDFQNGMDPWGLYVIPGFGDFADLWQNLQDLDPCRTNFSPQVAFFDDGTQVPGAGPSSCVSWCYGPGGHIINSTGGATHDDNERIFNSLESPVLDWPGPEFTGAQLVFDMYQHSPYTGWCCVIVHKWEVRSAIDPAQLSTAPWNSTSWQWFHGPDYVRVEEDISNSLVPGCTVFQVRVAISEIMFCYGGCTNDFSPAPYFDNFQITAFTSNGPHMSTSEINLAQDNFPESGQEVDLNNLASNNVRFDCAMNDLHAPVPYIPGDSITCITHLSQSWGELIENRLYYTMDRNPVFDSVRNAAWGISGHVDGIPLYYAGFKFYYDLPDSGFLFPGDVLHYYFSSTEQIDDGIPMTSTLPEDLTGFGDFSTPLAYNTKFEVHALPSIDAEGNQPPIIFWDDFGTSGGQEEWFGAFGNLGMEMGNHYDVYHTNGPASGEGNGLGGRASYDQIKGYSDLLYSSGDLGVYTISNGDFFRDGGRDVQLLTEWFSQQSVDAFFCGNQLAKDMNSSGELNLIFIETIMNVSYENQTIRDLINNQAAPLVLSVPDNTVFNTTTGWIANGSCPGNHQFDAIEAGEGAERLARFTNPAGAADYTYAAAVLNHSGDDRIITMPYDFSDIHTDANSAGGTVATRVQMLAEILDFFDTPGSFGQPVDAVAPVGEFFSKNYPNPFNPSTKIEFNLPKAGHLSLKVFNVRGELVKTLIDEKWGAGLGSIIWDGNNDFGEQVSSGVFFYEIRTAGKVIVKKMVLVK